MIYVWTLIIGGVLFGIGVVIYWRLGVEYKQIFEHEGTRAKLVDLLSHIPDTHAGPLPHVIAGLLTASGISLVLSAVIANTVFPTLEFGGTTVAISHVLVTVIFSAIAMWTLWQTRRIDFNAGYQVEDFHDLIWHINRDIEKLTESYQRIYECRAKPIHRVYLITTQPFLGMLSYPNSPETTKFKAHVETLSDFSTGNGQQPHFKFEVICGDSAAIEKFHEGFTDRFSAEEIANKTKLVETTIKQMNQRVKDAGGGDGPFFRKPNIPRVQFMIIGNKLYEFTLESQADATEIYNTQVINDARFCQAYLENFAILKSSLGAG